MERLQKVIANSGVTSRRKAEELIRDRRVKVNGSIVSEMGFKVSPKDKVEVDGVLIGIEDKVYFLLNKPRGVVATASDDLGRKTVVDLIPTDKRIYPVGRLDYDTTGLIILTNDGEFANYIMHPKNKIDKVYIAKIKGILAPNEQMILKSGVVIDGVKTSRSRVKVKKIDKAKDESIIELTIHEGKNHQVKRMLEAVGHEVLKLKREMVSFLDLRGLKSGEFRPLTPKEVQKLYVEFTKK